MEFFGSGTFWFIEGILFSLSLVALKYWAEDRHLNMPWWKWLLLLIWIFYCGFVIAFIGTNIGESELTAALRGGILFGLIAIISAVGLIRIINLPLTKTSESE